MILPFKNGLDGARHLVHCDRAEYLEISDTKSMYDNRTLKPQLRVDEHSVECPVLGCTHVVPRQRKIFMRDERFRCPTHDIYISASTHDHVKFTDNLLSADPDDLALIHRLLDQKRETERMGRERSEDALTFNVFRTLERAGQLNAVMSAIAGRAVVGSVPWYWSLNSATGTTDSRLAAARDAFHEVTDRGTEPDMLIDTEDTLILVEAKLGSKNETTPTHARSLKAYSAAQGGWYDRVFTSDAETVASKEKLYQLMRLWLLGTWMAEQAGKKFVLVSLCTAGGDSQIETRFGAHILTTDAHLFVRYTWERIREHGRSLAQNPEVTRLMEYLSHKTLGYDSRSALLNAFR